MRRWVIISTIRPRSTRRSEPRSSSPSVSVHRNLDYPSFSGSGHREHVRCLWLCIWTSTFLWRLRSSFDGAGSMCSRRKRTVEPYPRAGGRAVPKPTGRLTWPGRPADGDCRVPEPSAPPRGVIQCPRPVPRPRRHWCRARMAGATSPRAMAPARLRLIDQARTRVLDR